MHGDVCHAKVGNSICQGGGQWIVLDGVHAIAVLRGWGGHEGRNVDDGLPKGTECGKVHVVGWVIFARDPGLVLLREEASLMDDMNADVNNVLVGIGMLDKVGKCSSLEQAHDKEFEPLGRMPL